MIDKTPSDRYTENIRKEREDDGMGALTVTTYDIPGTGTALTLAVVADLHDRRGEETAERVLSLAPDACLFVGDLFESPPRRRRYATAEAVRCLEILAPHCALFWSRGNHDHTLPRDLAAVMERLGVHRLEDTYESFGGVLLGGLSSARYRKGRTPDLAFLRRFAAVAGYKILLSHHPEYYDRYIRGRGIDLTVSGHAHGGQWRFFGHGVYAPGQGLFPRYTSGFYDGGHLLVSRGVKPSRLPRIANPREILCLRLSE